VNKPGQSMTAVGSKSAVSLVSLIEQFGGDDEKCREFLALMRWPEGVRCPRCDSDKIGTLKANLGVRNGMHSPRKRNQFECSSCSYQFSVTSGSVFLDTHLPLWKWMLATYLIVDSKKGVSANQLRRQLNVSYKTAWYLCHRIRSAMLDTDTTPLSGVIEADETWIGGKRPGAGNLHGWDNKTMVLGALQRGGKVRLQVEHRRGTKPVLHAFIHANVDDGSILHTDANPSYIGVPVSAHESIDHSRDEWVRGDVTTNGIESAWSLLKRSIVGSFHQVSAKHLPAYLDEFSFRFNNRANAFLFRDTLLKLIEGDALPYADLISS
jgi:transposase-like protein